ncbi:unnamed protein product, partial [Owenia fusiformis]
ASSRRMTTGVITWILRRYLAIITIVNILSCANQENYTSSYQDDSNFDLEVNPLEKVKIGNDTIEDIQEDAHDVKTQWHCGKNKRSCSGRCGGSTNSSAIWDKDSSRHFCHCDFWCLHFQDCCIDFPIEIECPHISKNQHSAHNQHTIKRSHYECKELYEKKWIYTISKCTDELSPVRQLCEEGHESNILHKVPMVDPATHNVYKNIYCAQCNGVKYRKELFISIHCDSKVVTEQQINNPGYSMIKHMVNSKSCNISVSASFMRRCIPTLQECPQVEDHKTSHQIEDPRDNETIKYGNTKMTCPPCDNSTT